MKLIVVVFSLFFTLSASVSGKNISLNFYNFKQSPNSYAFASRNYAEAYKYITHSGYSYQNTVDSFLVIEGSQSRLDSLAELVSQKDNRFIESTHDKYVPHFFIFKLDELYEMLGTDSIIKTVLKWKGESYGGAGTNHRITVKIPQAGHGWSPHLDTLGDTLRGDAVDTNFALAPSWFTKTSFFKHELVIEPIIMNVTDSVTTLKTDYIEVVLITRDATITLTPFQKPRSVSKMYLLKAGQSETVIFYRVENQCDVALDIFSLSGTVIKRLDNGIKPPGNYRILWNGCSDHSSPVPGGTYIVKLSNGKNTETAGFSLVR